MTAALDKNIAKIDQRISKIQERLRGPLNPLPQRGLRAQRWILLLIRESVRDEVKIRAESLAYLTLFSILPIIAGGFFVFTIFAEFGMVQEALTSGIHQLLDTIPAQHRDFVFDYVLQFKDSYLASISGKSSSLGIFALIFLFWIGLRTFNNVEDMINRVWSSEVGRPFLERVRNFIVVVVCAPLVTIASLSIPLILRRIHASAQLIENVPLIGRLLDTVFPLGLVLATFTSVYRYLPIRRVAWKHAIKGGVFTTLGLWICNVGMNFYFRFGTNSAYGKAAVVPLIGFWVFLAWTIIIMGVEASYISQNEQQLLDFAHRSPSLYQGEALLALLFDLRRRHLTGTNPAPLSDLMTTTGLSTDDLAELLEYLHHKGWVIEVQSDLSKDEDESLFVLSRDIEETSLSAILEDYMLKDRRRPPQHPATQAYDKSLHQWLDSIKHSSFKDFRVEEKTQ